MSPTALPSDTATGGLPTRLDERSAVLARNWWLVAIRGVCAILFGVLTFAMPGLSLTTLVILFAAYLFADGVFAIAAAVRAAQKHERWDLLLIEGVVDIAAAVAAITMPWAATLLVVYLIAIWSIVSGVFMTIAAFQLHLNHGRWLLAVSGVISVLFGIMLAATPIAGAVVLTLWLGAYALVFGAVLLALAFQLRKRAVVAVPRTV